MSAPLVAVVIPSYKVTRHIMDVLAGMPDCVQRIYVVDDACPDGSGQFVQEHNQDPRVQVLFHEQNQGVGGAVMTGYRQALEDGVAVVVKVDGDGQMDPSLIPRFIKPILSGQADYTKGNRFYRPQSLQVMPKVRLFGNLALSFMTKLSSGYWPNMDPTNGYTAIATNVLKVLPLEKIAKRYFFETDLLFRLNTVRAVVKDIPMEAVYGDEVSNLNVRKVLPEFLMGNLSRMVKRYVYTYWIRDFNLGSLYSLFASLFLLFGCVFGALKWIASWSSHVPSSNGTVMLAGLTVLIGVQFLVAFLHFDVNNVPSQPVAQELE
ncbi:glycosyltransferase family 2 protein [Lampropedia puyangensis]|uniref:Glycosyltransferase family 2 protein n=1 Tax=Lampropedia puyangensis TaxID=1330072 RepID=A0A4S8EYU2_9BURK|nr:glycosyltransferase family 2 protein [Lampropedia puyangensis]THT97951.1 glycosyltransferase family 2 protein [Lampropedia puyangensis]